MLKIAFLISWSDTGCLSSSTLWGCNWGKRPFKMKDSSPALSVYKFWKKVLDILSKALQSVTHSPFWSCKHSTLFFFVLINLVPWKTRVFRSPNCNHLHHNFWNHKTCSWNKISSCSFHFWKYPCSIRSLHLSSLLYQWVSKEWVSSYEGYFQRPLGSNS